jgi:hypothetical protein
MRELLSDRDREERLGPRTTNRDRGGPEASCGLAGSISPGLEG